MIPGIYRMFRRASEEEEWDFIAEVAIFGDQSAVTQWMTGKDSTAVWRDVKDMLDIHIDSHPGTTKLVLSMGRDVYEEYPPRPCPSCERSRTHHEIDCAHVAYYREQLEKIAVLHTEITFVQPGDPARTK